jgi:sugar/nucleoside kinase (ribokinase family)
LSDPFGDVHRADEPFTDVTVAGSRIIAFGDVIDDIVVVPHGPIREDTDTESSIRFRPGGSPANTAAWLGFLGAPVDFVGTVAMSDVARHAAELAAAGVTPHLRGHETLPTGTIVVIVDGQRRTMLTERGANAVSDPVFVTGELLAPASVLHLTGHALLNDAGAAGFAEVMARARAASVAISIAPGSAGFIADYGVEAFLADVAGASILFPALEEGRLLTGLTDPTEVAESLAETFNTVVLTLGADGVIVAHGGEVTLVKAVALDVVDPTGAGDAFCAGFLDEWVRTGVAVGAARAGTLVAALAVSVIGARPRV